MADAQPERIGKYEILGTLGKGAMGLVYRARDAALHREVALKVITGTDDITDEMLERFRIEARAAASLDHPNIVVVYDLGEDEGRPYIAMELLKGCDLRQHVRTQDGIGPREAADLVAQVCDGLAYAHARRIIHRDIKPANIHVCPDNRVKIVDFGVAKMESTALTRTGMVIGTPDYMSPEQIQGKGIDTRSDIFSTGVVLYELLTGKKPFSADSITSVVYNIVFNDPPGFQELDLPDDLTRIVARAMAKDLKSRYQDIGEMRDDLRAWLSGGTPKPRAVEEQPEAAGTDETAAIAAPVGSPASSGPASRTLQVGESPEQRRRAAGELPLPPPKTPTRKGRGGLFVGVGAAVLLAGVALAAFFLLGGGGESAETPDATPDTVRTAGGAAAPLGEPVPVDVVVSPWARIDRLERRDGDSWASVTLSETVTPVRLILPPGHYRMKLTHPQRDRSEEITFDALSSSGADVRHVLDGFDWLNASADLLSTDDS